jgi:exopolysaccharide biosynthesis predicted pyruvyltransferase EpsI
MITHLLQYSRKKSGLTEGRTSLQPLRKLVEDYLRQYSKTTVLYYPNPGNAGDSLLVVATLQAFSRCSVDFQAIDLSAAVDDKIVFLGGGGNFVPLYDHIESAYQKFLGRAQKIVLLPHTIRGNEKLLRRLDQTCTLFCRDSKSYNHVRSINRTCEIILAHDMAFHLDAKSLLDNRELAHTATPVLRDKLRSIGINEDMIRQKSSIDFSRLDTESRSAFPKSDLDIGLLYMLGVWPHQAPTAAWCFLKTISMAPKITTDRLHVGIGSALLGVPCELRDNSYGKNKAVYQHSLKSFSNIRFTGR